MYTTRRRFLSQALAVTAGFHGLRTLAALGHPVSARRATDDRLARGFGPLVPDPQGLLELPEGFSYTILSRMGDAMDDGLRVPGMPDGMGAFPGPDGTVVLIRNHENQIDWKKKGAFGPANELVGKLDPRFLYDPGRDGSPCLGGTTTIHFDPASRAVRRQFLSLAGTEYNCAGGQTPWGTWISCEESTLRAGSSGGHGRDHGFAFEVAPRLDAATPPVPLTAMGRFRREAVAIDPRTGVVYQTEDLDDGVFYRFLPTRPGALREGGRLQALAAIDAPRLDARNWLDKKSRAPVAPRIDVATRFRVRWIDLDDVAAPNDDLRLRAFAAGAARFARTEGAWFGHSAVFFAATTGGAARKGQIWKYTPGPAEGTQREIDDPGVLELFAEPNDAALVDNCDNLTIAPWGDLVICEDACDKDDVENFLVGVTPDGRFYKLARNTRNTEFAGAVFSPDGQWLFVNLQEAGLTLAITGPWGARM